MVVLNKTGTIVTKINFDTDNADSKNDFDVYFNFLEYDKYGRIISYKGENPVYIKRDNVNPCF